MRVNTRAAAGGYCLLHDLFVELERFSGLAILGTVAEVAKGTAAEGKAIGVVTKVDPEVVQGGSAVW